MQSQNNMPSVRIEYNMSEPMSTLTSQCDHHVVAGLMNHHRNQREASSRASRIAQTWRRLRQRLHFNVMSCHVMSCHVMSCHVVSCFDKVCNVFSCNGMSYHDISHNNIPCGPVCATSCRAMSSHVRSHHVAPCQDSSRDSVDGKCDSQCRILHSLKLEVVS